MKIVKSWKKNLKRTGALALATLVMCGGASFARAEDAENIILNQLGSLNGVGLDESNGQYKTVLGYQTGDATGYAANITWGDMIFVYDNGTYNPNTGRIQTTTDLICRGVEANADRYPGEYFDNNTVVFDVYTDTIEGGDYYKFCNGKYYSVEYHTEFTSDEGTLTRTGSTLEMTKKMAHDQTLVYEYGVYQWWEDHEQYVVPFDTPPLQDVHEEIEIPVIGQWYGFDGVNNAVTIENLSSSNVKVGASWESGDSEKVGNAKFSFYVIDDAKVKHAADDTPLTAADDQNKFDIAHMSGEQCYYARIGEAIQRDFTAVSYGEHGIVETLKNDKSTIYLNITGKPGDGIIHDNAYTGSNASTLGKITLNFTTGTDETLKPVLA